MVHWSNESKGGVSIWLKGLLEYIEDGLGFWFLNRKAILVEREGNERERSMILMCVLLFIKENRVDVLRYRRDQHDLYVRMTYTNREIEEWWNSFI